MGDPQQFIGVWPRGPDPQGSVELPGIGVISLSHRYEKAGDKFTEVTGSMKVRFRPAGDLRREIERLTGFDV